ncbi:adenosylcobinamide-GDP ribazoletransferase [Thiobacillus denitrificans]|uniref:adenosylcobinamide-GDP ribazoletransferase n=1 Tax=Thiobacillus denitrificans TaxID=36861 RepID=UPI001EE44F00|nr:adenosylcobinamide-GDP ribazoletransferase [Thiobacillus denitrificans]
MTRLPLPVLRDFQCAELVRAVVWFPAAGLVVGAAVALAAALGTVLDPWLGALAGVVMWAWITGGLHLDGLADTADALGAAHRDPARFLTVLADPHVGSFGVIVLVLQLAAKLVLLHWLLTLDLPWPALVLIPAWTRWAAAGWTLLLPPLKPGLGERFAWQGNRAGWGAGGLALAAVSAITPIAFVALIPAVLWGVWMWLKLGGQTGDILGAGIEWSESAALLLAGVSLALARGIIAG